MYWANASVPAAETVSVPRKQQTRNIPNLGNLLLNRGSCETSALRVCLCFYVTFFSWYMCVLLCFRRKSERETLKCIDKNTIVGVLPCFWTCIFSLKYFGIVTSFTRKCYCSTTIQWSNHHRSSYHGTEVHVPCYLFTRCCVTAFPKIHVHKHGSMVLMYCIYPWTLNQLYCFLFGWSDIKL